MEIIIALLGLISLLLLLLVFQASGIKAALSRLENQSVQSHKKPEINPLEQTDSGASEAQQSAFDEFLAEDPQRLSLPKSEQFAAYREWRKEKGMTWSS